MPFRPHALGSSLRAGSANVHIGDSWTALDQVGPNGTQRPVTCDLVRKLGCARCAVVQLPRRSSSGNAPDLLVRCSIEIPVLPFSQQGLATARILAERITLDVSACRVAC